jgi:hypothetical protein
MGEIDTSQIAFRYFFFLSIGLSGESSDTTFYVSLDEFHLPKMQVTTTAIAIMMPSMNGG